jgi:succinate dehydrogenase/fumarate reductase-like Fe-S protein
MKDYITASIFRYDPDKHSKPYYDEYRIRAREEMTVLTLLDYIQKNIDNSLSFRSYCCGLQMCGSCLMKVNNRKRFACITLVKPGDKVIIDPTTYPNFHIKDLVVRLDNEE